MELRPHHGICIGQFMGKGYSEEFVENMTRIIATLEQEEETLVKLVCRTDSICGSCTHNEHNTCSSGQKVMEYDRACLSLCGLMENQLISWSEFKEKVMTNIIQPGRLKQVCVNCSWLDICTVNAGMNY